MKLRVLRSFSDGVFPFGPPVLTRCLASGAAFRRHLARPMGSVLIVVSYGCGGSAPEPHMVRKPPPPPAATAVFAPAPPQPLLAAREPVATAVPPNTSATPLPSEPPRNEEPTLSDDGKPRVYAPKGLIKIYEKADYMSPVIGAFRAGQSIRLKETALTDSRKRNKMLGCTEGWYPVVPRGFVCVGGDGHATRDKEDPAYIAAAAVLPDTDSPYPFHFGTSVGAPQYLRIPTAAEQRENEPGLDDYLKNLPPSDPQAGGSIDSTPATKAPSKALLRYLEMTAPPLLNDSPAFKGMKVSWAREFEANGRSWLLTPDMTIIPKDKVRTKAMPTLKGIDLKAEPQWTFPLGFTWQGDINVYRLGSDGKLQQTDDIIKRHTFVGASMQQKMGPGGIYWKLQNGDFVRYKDISIIRKAKYRPSGVGKTDKWVEARVTWGYLIAYEGDTPVYVTAMSPGVDGINPRSHATARGRHYVGWKLLSADMSGNDGKGDWFVDEVPWVQYYKGNYALHGAWWHDNFGRPMSHGCVNLAPADARALFHWMDPVIPEGWYAASAYYPYAQGTVVYVRP